MNIILFCLLFEHVFSYVSSVYRNNEIKKSGKPDVYGVYRAKNEMKLGSIQLFIDCCVFGYTIKHMSGMSWQLMHSMPYVVYWIVIDCVILFISQPYNYFSQLVQIKSEVAKNMSTLSHCQRTAIAEMKACQNILLTIMKNLKLSAKKKTAIT